MTGNNLNPMPSNSPQPKRPLSIRVTPSIFDRLESASEVTGVSVTSLIELCVSQRLDAVVAEQAERRAAGVRRFLAEGVMARKTRSGEAHGRGGRGWLLRGRTRLPVERCPDPLGRAGAPVPCRCGPLGEGCAGDADVEAPHGLGAEEPVGVSGREWATSGGALFAGGGHW